MKRLYLYKEIFYQIPEQSYASIKNNMNKLSDNLADEILAYLENGYKVMTFVSPISDPYNANDIYPYEIYTDGFYIWDSTIIHWVKKYKIRLPSEFIEYVKNHGLKDFSKQKIEVSVDKIKNAELIWL